MFPSAPCTQTPSISLKLGIKILVPNVYIPVRHGLWIFCSWIMTIHHHVTCQISTATTTGSVPLFTNMNWTWSMIPRYRFRMFCQPRGWRACVATSHQSGMSPLETFSVSFLWLISRSWQCLRLHGVESSNGWCIGKELEGNCRDII
jgi:hypothetical protein